MRLTKTKNWIIRGGLLAATGVGASFVFAACEAQGPPRPRCEDVSDAGTSDRPEIVPYTAITTDAQPPEAYGMETDPGPTCTDCRQSEEYEIMTVSDFEDGFAPAWFNYGEPGILIEPPQAGEGLSDSGIPTGSNPPQPWWGLQVADISQRPGGTRCGSKYALHLEGARFAQWGGGYVTRHFITRGEYMNRCSPDEGQCLCKDPADLPDSGSDAGSDGEFGIGVRPKYMPESVQTASDAHGCMFWASPVAGQPSLLGVDLADFEGVSFWARRGPSGQSTLRVALIDDSVSADLALYKERIYYEQQIKAGVEPSDIDIEKAGARCTRVKECCEVCTEVTHQEYVAPAPGEPLDDPDSVRDVPDDKRCWLEGERLPHFAIKTVDANGNASDPYWAAWDFRDSECGDVPTTEDTTVKCWSGEVEAIYNQWKTDFALCCPMTMEQERALNNPAERSGDPRYGGDECMPYVFNFDQSSGNYCYAPGEMLPEKNQNRCDEGFESAVNVDTEWKLFTIPWRELRRFTPDKPPFNPDGVWQIAFYFGQGYLDTYVDDVGFYKRRPSTR